MIRRPISPATSSVGRPAEGARPSWQNGFVAAGGAALGYAGLCAGLFRAAGRGADAFVVAPRAIDEASAPSWLPPAEVARLNALGEAVRGRSILDRTLAHDLAGCYAESPWVARVLHVRRAYPNRLGVSLAIRKPFVVIHAAAGPPVILDAEGVRLPASADPAGLVRLSGAGTFAPPPGQKWDTPRVGDGLRALGRYASLLEGRPRLAPFAPREVRVSKWSRADARPIVEIVTARGFPVIWGVDLPDGSPTVGAPSAREKLESLAQVLPDLAREARAVAYVSVRHRSGVLLKLRKAPRPSGRGRGRTRTAPRTGRRLTAGAR